MVNSTVWLCVVRGDEYPASLVVVVGWSHSSSDLPAKSASGRLSGQLKQSQRVVN